MDKAQRGREAQAILTSPLVQEAFAQVEAACIDAWKRSDPGDTGTREDAHKLLRASALFRRFFETCVSTGRLAEADEETRRKHKGP